MKNYSNDRKWTITHRSQKKLTYCEVGQIYKVELIIIELGNTLQSCFNLVAFVNSADANY